MTKPHANSGIYFLPDNIIVWEPEGFPIESAPAEDIVFQVTVDNVLIDGTPQSFSYSVTVIDPDRTVAQPTSTPTATPGITPVVTATPTATPGPPPVAVLPEHLFDIGLNWQSEDYSGPADLTGDGRVDEEDIFDAIRNWSD